MHVHWGKITEEASKGYVGKPRRENFKDLELVDTLTLDFQLPEM